MNAEVESAVRHITTEIVGELKRATPIATGYASASWSTQYRIVLCSACGRPWGPCGAACRADCGLAALLTYQVEQGPVYITNNSGYVGEILSPAGQIIAIHRGLANVRFR